MPKRVTSLKDPMFSASEQETVLSMINAQHDPEMFVDYVEALKGAIHNHFGAKTTIHPCVYSNHSSNPKDWELLLELESHWRPSAFAEKIQSFVFPGFETQPVDVCRYRRR